SCPNGICRSHGQGFHGIRQKYKACPKTGNQPYKRLPIAVLVQFVDQRHTHHFEYPRQYQCCPCHYASPPSEIGSGVTSFSPMTPANKTPTSNSFGALNGSLNRMISESIVPAVPKPTKTA